MRKVRAYPTPEEPIDRAALRHHTPGRIPADHSPSAIRSHFPIGARLRVTGARKPGETGDKTVDQKAKILSTIDTMTNAFHKGDIDGIMRTYEPGAVVVGKPGAPISGTPALRAMFAGFIAAKGALHLPGSRGDPGGRHCPAPHPVEHGWRGPRRNGGGGERIEGRLGGDLDVGAE